MLSVWMTKTLSPAMNQDRLEKRTKFRKRRLRLHYADMQFYGSNFFLLKRKNIGLCATVMGYKLYNYQLGFK